MEWWRADSSNQAEEGEVETAWLPPGFRFHPTDEELLTYYLRNKVQNVNFTDLAVSEVDFNKVEPWDLPGRAKIGEKEWYFFSLRDRKYPTGMRTNRATDAGYWKATGKDREITCSRTFRLLGMKKTLVFYKGRAPKGVKTNWVIHEYRLEGSNFRDSEHPALWRKDEWVVCRVFKKSVPTPSIDFKSVSTTSLEVKYGQPYYEILSDIDSSLPALESPQMHMQHPPCSSPQQETPLFHNCSYNHNESNANESIGSRNRDNKALISSSFGNIASTAVPFRCLQQEAAGFNYYKAHPSPCLFPSSSPNEPRKQQYNDYSTIDCKIELPYQSFSHSELPVTRSNMFARNTCTHIEALWTGTTNATPYNEADAISVDLMPTTL